jgi:hypothetical protein
VAKNFHRYWFVAAVALKPQELALPLSAVLVTARRWMLIAVNVSEALLLRRAVGAIEKQTGMCHCEATATRTLLSVLDRLDWFAVSFLFAASGYRPDGRGLYK